MRNKTKLDEVKIEALRLKKSIKQSLDLSFEEVKTLCERLQKLPQLASLSTKKIQAQLTHLTLNECLDLVALEMGEESWYNLSRKHSFLLDSVSDDALIYVEQVNDSVLNAWFPNYEEAKAYQLSQKNSFLFKYKTSFFVCSSAYIENLGIDAFDSDWSLIGRDWVKPLCIQAQTRLRNKLIQARSDQINKN